MTLKLISNALVTLVKLKKIVLKNCLKLSTSHAGSLSSSGSEFQTVGPATGKARRPYVSSRHRGAMCVADECCCLQVRVVLAGAVTPRWTSLGETAPVFCVPDVAGRWQRLTTLSVLCWRPPPTPRTTAASRQN